MFIILSIAIALLVAPTSAFAYLDPGTGSYVLQIVIGGLLAGAIAVKAFWARIRAFLDGLFSKNSRGK